MAENKNQILWGEGVVFIGGKELFEVQELALNFGINTLTAQKGDGGSQIVIPTGQPITGRCGFLGINSATLAVLTGATAASGANYKRIRSEELTVASDAVTTTETPIAATLRVVEKGANKVPLQQVASSPDAGEYTVSGTTIGFNASQFADGVKILVSYIYADTEGETVTFSPDTLPDSFALWGTLRSKELFGDVTGDVIIYAAKCDRTSEFGLGGSIGNISTPGFDFNIRVDTEGDLEFYFPA